MAKSNASRDSWENVIADYEQKKAEADKAWAASGAADEAYCEDSPCRDWTEYGLSWTIDNREDALKAMRYYPALTAGKAAAAGTPLTDDELDALYKELPTIADRFFAAKKADAEAEARFHINERQTEAEAAHELFYNAREKLFRTPAPDAAAIVFKLDVIADLLIEHCDEDADSVVAIRDDARRLLGKA